MRQLLGDIGKAAGVADCTPHAFRRAFALWNLRKGMNIYVLARLMGHADIVVLRRYLDLVETDLADAHGRAAAVDAFLR
jgi:site-specific recombinase XerD